MTRTRALVTGGLVVGILDILDAFVFFYLRSGVRPARILQSIAAGVMGREAAIAGGNATAALGLALHFVIAFAIVIVFWAVARAIPALVRRPLVTGALYGLAVWGVMNYVVLPLSATSGPAGLPPLPVLVNGLLIHIFGVGIPAALAARAALARR